MSNDGPTIVAAAAVIITGALVGSIVGKSLEYHRDHREKMEQCAKDSRTVQGTLEGAVTKEGEVVSLNLRVPQPGGTAVNLPFSADYMVRPDSIDSHTYSGRLEGQAQVHAPMHVTYCTTNYVVKIVP